MEHGSQIWNDIFTRNQNMPDEHLLEYAAIYKVQLPSVIREELETLVTEAMYAAEIEGHKATDED